MLTWFLWIILAVVAPDVASAQISANDAITEYIVDISLQQDGRALIVEQINYDFGLYSGHGIYRSIPARYVYGIFNRNIDLELQRVTNQQGRSWPVKTVSPGEFNEPDGNVVWRIGDPHVSVEGEQTYYIEYTVDRAFLYDQDYTEWYWNAIGHSWTVPIEYAQITVHIPPESLQTQHVPTCYRGAYGDNNTSTCSVNIIDNETIQFTAAELLPHHGVTVDLALSSDQFNRPSQAIQFWNFIKDNWSLVLVPIIALVFVILTALDRPAHSRRPIIPIYEAPAQLSAVGVEVMMRGTATARGLAAALIELARTGYIHFIYDEKRKSVTELKKIKADVPRDPIATKVLQTIFGQKTSVILKQTVVNKSLLFTEMRAHMRDQALAQQWFYRRKLNVFYLGIGWATLMGIASGFMIVQGFSNYLYHWGVVGILTIIMIVSYALLHYKYRPLSPTGADIVNELEGFKWFLRVTEAERVKFTSAPKLTPQLFEQLLPYAVAFGVEKEWVDQFKHILVEPPTWMEGNVTNIILARALLSTAHVSADFKVPQTRSSSGGFGGGGFSGGGFGGGGGGRW